MKRFSVISVVLLAGIGVMLNSCVENDVDVLRDDSNILRFGVSSAIVNTRAADVAEGDIAEQADSVCWRLMEVEGDEEFSKPLYVTMVSEPRKAVKGDEYVSEDAETRGAPVTTDTFASVYGECGFGLFAYVYAPDAWDENSTKSEYIHNQPVTYMSPYWAFSGTQYYWPGANYKMRFYAYAPYAEGYYDDIINVQSTAYVGVPKIDITVSETNTPKDGEKRTSHPDLLIAKSGEVPGNQNGKQELTFWPAFSAITFKVGAMFVKGTIKKIEFQNVLRSGTLNLESQAWENIDEANPATISLTKDIAISGDAGQKVLVEDDYFMMLPQTLPEDAELVITFVQSSNGKVHTIKSPIGQQDLKWEMGYIHTYTLTAKRAVEENYIFEVTAPSKTTADYLGDVPTEGTVKSYRTYTNIFGIETKEAVKWTTEYSTDGGSSWKTTRPEFFSSFTEGAAGKVEATDKYEGTIAPITPDDPKNPFGATVDKRPVNTATINLADPDKDGKHSTANCYVVNAAGTYTFPMVYGNAINNEKNNTKAYSSTKEEDKSNEHYLYFKDYADDDITSPYISPNKLHSAKLLWTDAPNLIRDVKLSKASETMSVVGTNVRYITFTVPKEHLAPGNAVIAICDSEGAIMWSWHIWVTPWKGTSVAVNYKFTTSGGTTYTATYNLSDTVLGYCPTKNTTWKARNVKVRFKQAGSGKVSSTYTFEQSGKTIQYSVGNMPYYQWGRKDPLLMYNYITNSDGTATGGTEKTCYGLKKQSYTLRVYDGGYKDYKYTGHFYITNCQGTGRKDGVYMSTSIQNPCRFYARRKSADDPISGDEYDWCDQMGYNRWDSATTGNVKKANAPNDKASNKTIYDPCPPGWCVPTAGAFYGLTEAGNATNASPRKTTMSDSDLTPAFQVKAYGGKTVKIPITGDRNRFFGSPWYTSLQSRNVELWTATPSTEYVIDNNVSCAAYYVELDDKKESSENVYDVNYGSLAKSSGFAVLPVKESISNKSW